MLNFQQAVKFLRNFAKKSVKLTACIFLITACEKPNNATNPSIQAPNSTLKRAIYAAEFQLDPHKMTNATNAAPIRDLLVGLTAYNPQGKIVPAIAQNWFSEDQRSWLFILDEKAKWSNGEPVKAQDFVASWQRLIDPQNHSPNANYLLEANIENAEAIQRNEKPLSDLGVVALNDHSLQILLSQADSRLPEKLAHFAFLPTYQGLATTAQTLVSNGAYQLANSEGQKIVLTARSPLTAFQRVEYELLATHQNASKVDIVENPPLSQRENIVKFPSLCAYYYEFNFDDPQLSRKPIREALRAMLSLNIGQAFGLPSQSVIPHHLVKDREKAWKPIVVEQRLAQAGITPAEPLKLTLLYDDNDLNNEVANQMIRTLSQSELFQIIPKMVSKSALAEIKKRKAFQLVRSGWCADSPDPLLFLQKFASNSAENFSGYHNDIVDQTLAYLQSEILPQDERNELIRVINDILYDDVAVLPLFQRQTRVGIVSSLLGIDLNNDSEVIYSKDLKRISTQKEQE